MIVAVEPLSCHVLFKYKTFPPEWLYGAGSKISCVHLCSTIHWHRCKIFFVILSDNLLSLCIFVLTFTVTLWRLFVDDKLSTFQYSEKKAVNSFTSIQLDIWLNWWISNCRISSSKFEYKIPRQNLIIETNIFNLCKNINM